MKLAAYFAKRYFFSKKSIHAINIISGISVIGVMVSTASLIAILSFYNGLENLLLSMFSSVASELRIEPTTGKVFDPTLYPLFDELQHNGSIRSLEPVLEEKVLFQRGEHQLIGRLKGVNQSFLDHWKTDSLYFHGDFKLYSGMEPVGITGQGIHYELGMAFTAANPIIRVYSPRKGVINPINPAEEFIRRDIEVSGVMGGHEELNDLLIVPMEFAQEVLGEYGGVSALEINVRDPRRLERVYHALSQQLGPDLKVLSREEQNPTLYKIIRSEKWAIFAILTFTGIIAVLNIIGSLTMLVIDKRKDIAVLKGLGASARLIKRIFFLEGMMISLIGVVSGLLIGLLICLSQLWFGWLKFAQAEHMVIDVYPVDIRMMDFILVFATVLSVAVLISALASRLAMRQNERLS